MSQRSDPPTLVPCSQLKSAWSLVMSATVVSVWDLAVLADHRVGGVVRPADRLEARGLDRRGVLVTVSRVCSTLSDLVSLNCTGQDAALGRPGGRPVGVDGLLDLGGEVAGHGAGPGLLGDVLGDVGRHRRVAEPAVAEVEDLARRCRCRLRRGRRGAGRHQHEARGDDADERCSGYGTWVCVFLPLNNGIPERSLRLRMGSWVGRDRGQERQRRMGLPWVGPVAGWPSSAQAIPVDRPGAVSALASGR